MSMSASALKPHQPPVSLATSPGQTRTLSIRAPSVVVAVLMDSRSCARPHTTQAADGGHVAIGCTSFPALACCCRNVFCRQRRGPKHQLHMQ
jgi:hypothetical protein